VKGQVAGVDGIVGYFSKVLIAMGMLQIYLPCGKGSVTKLHLELTQFDLRSRSYYLTLGGDYIPNK